MNAFRPCAVIPCYDNPLTVEEVVRRVAEHLETVVVVDDGSGSETRYVLDRLAERGLITLVRRTANGGKGAAMKMGLASAAALGFSHALQVDADLQHELDDIPRFLSTAREQPRALVLGSPQFDETRPPGRGFGHALTAFWTRVEVGSDAIEDPQCGFRVYPLEDANAVRVSSNRMDYDIEVCVRMAWRGCPVVNIPTRVRYLAAEAGGISHFHMVYDNVRISWMHTRLVVTAIWRWSVGLVRGGARS